MSDNLIRASEIGDYLYCRRKWFLRHRQGIKATNQTELQSGTAHHERHAYWLNRSRLAGQLAVVMMLMALLFLGYWFWGG
ncbi:MAG: hypothetical protein KDE09_16650 [Anaerolineales bacterium]|nr:hypothetical protein [Anaerolineales bacterium]MCB0019424.1 hypothetical protein [Anaerolineales bacterium]MCB8962592.1 hypothetical protein [Ardenticatenales bacterium]